MQSKTESFKYNENFFSALIFIASLSVGAFIGTFALPIPLVGTFLGGGISLGAYMFVKGLYHLLCSDLKENLYLFLAGASSTLGLIAAGGCVGGLIGSVVPGLGTAIGTIAGACLGLILGLTLSLTALFFTGKLWPQKKEASFLDINHSEIRSSLKPVNLQRNADKPFFDYPYKPMAINPSDTELPKNILSNTNSLGK